MCNFWSCVLTRDGRVLWDKDDNRHEMVITANNLMDNKLEDRDFVRLEIAPKVIWSKKKSDWTFKVDERGTLPEWYTDAPKKWESVVWREWRKAMSETLWKLDLSIIGGIVEEVMSIHYMDTHGQPDPAWHLTLAETWVAAGFAAWDAAGFAAWDAAGFAAWDAARDAARDAAGAAALYMICKLAPNIDERHITHANARMEVWRRGYALLCEVNGVLYVYGVKKDQ